MPGSDGARMAERSYPESEVRGSGREEPPHVQGRGGQPRGATPHLRPGAAAGRNHPASEARGNGREEPHHIQGAVAAWAQEGQEELSHIEGQEGLW